jgi:hypothetical protein
MQSQNVLAESSDPAWNVTALRNELEQCSAGDHRKRSDLCWRLSRALFQPSPETEGKERREPTDDDLEEAVELGREAFNLLPDDTSLHAMHFVVQLFVGALVARFRRKGDLADLSKATQLQTDIYEAHREHDPVSCSLRISSIDTLTDAYFLLFDQTGRKDLLDMVGYLSREMLDLLPAGDPEQFSALTNLAGTLQMRFEHTGDIDLLNEALALHKDVLKQMPPNHPERSSVCMNVAAAMITRSREMEDSESDETILALYEEALELRPVGHPGRSAACNGLSAILKTYFRKTHDIDYLRRSIDLERECMSLRPPGHPARKNILLNVASTLHLLTNSTLDEDFYDEAMVVNQELLNTERLEDFTKRRAFLNVANLHTIPNLPQYNPEYAVENLHNACSVSSLLRMPIIYGLQPMMTSLERLKIDQVPEDFMPKLLVIYEKVIDALPLLAGFALSSKNQLHALRRSENIGRDAFLCAKKVGDIGRGVQLLDSARGMLWSQVLFLEDNVWKNVPGEAGDEVRSVLRTLASRGSPPIDGPSQSRNEIYSAQDSLFELLAQMREMPGGDRILVGSPIESLAMAAAYSIVVVLVGTEEGCYAVIIRSPVADLECVTLDAISIEEIRGLVENARSFERLVQNSIDDSGDCTFASRVMHVASYLPGTDTVSKDLAILWRRVVQPVINKLNLEVKSDDNCYRPYI